MNTVQGKTARQLLTTAGLEQLALTGTGHDRLIRAITADSRHVQPDTLFAALSGTRHDGRQFVDHALQKGACGLLTDNNGFTSPRLNGVAHFTHPDPRTALAHLAAAFYDHPARTLSLIGITGTNGKTTVAAMIEAIGQAAGRPTGVIGTTGIRWPHQQHPNPLTTPDPVTLHRILRQMADAACQMVALEVSSHALVQQRTAGLPFHVAVFTNLSRDHLDYHPSEEAYFAAKAGLFSPPPPVPPPTFALLNLDDRHGVELGRRLPASQQTIGFTLQEKGGTDHPVQSVIRAQEIRLTRSDCRFRLVTPEGSVALHLPTIGAFNVANALAAAGTALALGVSLTTIAQGLNHFRPQPGRMITVQQGQPFGVIIDFAHTPAALENLLRTARQITPHGRILTLFGCGGNRDRGKRRLMGRIAGSLSDHVLITDDNPRQEDPAAIRADIVQGCLETTKPTHMESIGDRQTAIARGLTLAQPGDLLLLAGKGHETVQIIGQETLPFDDHQVVIACLRQRGYDTPRQEPPPTKPG